MTQITELFNTELTYSQQQEVWYEFFNQTLPEWLFIGFIAILAYIVLCHILRNKLIFKLVLVIVFLIPILFVEGIQHLFRS
ncbi:hypothetical protein [Streptococcus salivarius]|uniref:hypothetical protein n=1 Tax=Streptococcus salivarius TaxID=1304 RepID=UPI0011A8B2B4|nr:hypothetical protein [Streptococcus salivarius]